jgi:hypothetical protein
MTTGPQSLVVLSGWQPLSQNNGVYSTQGGIRVEYLGGNKFRLHVAVTGGGPGVITMLPFRPRFAQAGVLANNSRAAAVQITTDGFVTVYPGVDSLWLMGHIDFEA